MTEVNRSNFSKLIPEIIDKLKTCTFVSIDAEYTGLFSPDPKIQNSLFDSASDRYQKLRNGFSNYQISQFGLAIFNRCWERNEYTVDAYNIYLYPVAFDDYRDRDVIHCQISSFNFLAANNFDFNKFIKEGVPYLRKEDRRILRQYMRANPMFMRWMEHRDRTYFPQFIEKLNDDDAETIIGHLNGFTKVIQIISELKKPIVGHNMLMDLLLIYKQFYEDLPPSYKEFKVKIHKLFPYINDTKHIAASLRRDLQEKNSSHTNDIEYLYDTSLFGLYVNTSKVKDFFIPFVTCINETRDRYRIEIETGLTQNLEKVKGSHCHEAGFDALITGAVFLRLAHIAARRDEQFLLRRSFPPTVAETLNSLNNWKNCVNIVRAPIRYINFEGEDPPIDKPNWIRVKGNPSQGKLLDISWIRNHLPKYGDIEVVQLNNQSVLLACSAWSSARNVWMSLEEEGYILSAQEFPMSTYGSLTLVAGVTLGSAIVFLTTLICLRKFV